MLKTTNQNKKAEHPQMKADKFIANAIGCTPMEAFMNASQVKRRLTVTVSDSLFIPLVNLCYKIGVEKFHSSLPLWMANTKHNERSIKKYIGLMLS